MWMDSPSKQETTWRRHAIRPHHASTSHRQDNTLDNNYGQIWIFLGLIVASYFFFYRRRQSGGHTRVNAGTSSEEATNSRKEEQKPVISITINHIILSIKENRDISLITESVAAFLQFCGLAELYVVATVSNDEEQEVILNKLAELEAEEKGLKPHRILFCSTNEGRSAMIRQLRPALHIESDSSVVDTLTGKIPQVMLLKIKEKTEMSPRASGWHSLHECLEIATAILKKTIA